MDVRSRRSLNARGPIATGHTLIELIVSLAIASILLIAVASSIILAGTALPDAKDETSRLLAAAQIADDIAGELQFARSFGERSASGAEFTVGDRDGNGVLETIRYQWSGVAGEPLTRQYNGGAAIAVVDAVESFELLYETIVVSEEITVPVESGEIELSSKPSAVSSATVDVESSLWIGQYFQPSLPAEATSWKVTRVLVKAMQSGSASGETLVQLRPADVNSLPTTTVLESYSMYESDLGPGPTWQQFSSTNVSGRSPGEGLCIVLEWVSGSQSCGIEYDGAGGSRVESTDSGGSWSSVAGEVLYYVYGTYTSPDTIVTIDHTYLTGIQIKIQADSDPSSALETGMSLLHPQEIVP